MRALNPASLLDLWERGHGLHPIDQGLLAIHAVLPDTLASPAADWPLGQRNRMLARIRCACFGSRLRGWTACRQCGESLEFDVDAQLIADTRASHDTHDTHDADDTSERDDAQVVVERHGAYRLPTSRDLASVATGDAGEASDAARALLARCRLDGDDVSGTALLSDADVDAIGEQLALADPLAEILLDFACPACGDTFRENLDLSSFLWAEIEAEAERVLWEVHALAFAYHWSEATILALSPARRAHYLAMVRA